MLEEFIDDYVMSGVTEAAQTPPFFTERRVIAVRRMGAFSAEDVEALVSYAIGVAVAAKAAADNKEDFVDFTDFVIEWGSGRVSDPLRKAIIEAGGQVQNASLSTQSDARRSWWESEVEARGLDLDHRALVLVIEWLGEDAARFDGLSEILRATYGPKKITADMVKPFLGQRGDALPWDLTDSIDKGNATEALRAARRMMQAGDRHPLQILAQLHNHYARLAKLDDRGVESWTDAKAVLGLKSDFPAKKAYNTFRTIGHDGVRRAFELLSRADSDLRGGTGLEEDVVMDVLVARLARLAPAVSRRR